MASMCSSRSYLRVCIDDKMDPSGIVDVLLVDRKERECSTVFEDRIVSINLKHIIS